jgi:autotransporter-associated beta strand protein
MKENIHTNDSAFSHRRERSRRLLLAAIIVLLWFAAIVTTTHAGSGTWKSAPEDGNWNNPSNWSCQCIPNGISESAEFSVTSITDILIPQSTTVLTLFFGDGASSYSFTCLPGANLTVYQLGGLLNYSGVVQKFEVMAENGTDSYTALTFQTSATITGDIVVTNDGATVAGGATSSSTGFEGCSAGNTVLVNEPGSVSGALGGETDFYENSHGDTATITNKAGMVAGAFGGQTMFYGGDAGAAVITCEGASISGGLGGTTTFLSHASAGKATLVAQPGSNGGAGGTIVFQNQATGGSARVQLFGNGTLDISNRQVTIGSLTGDGIVLTGSRTLTIGAANLSSTFSGLIQDNGALNKTGTGTFTLASGNSYTGGTTIGRGALTVTNKTGSATGTGPVSVTSGVLGGSGILGGKVTVGTGSGSGAFLAPAAGSKKQAILTIQSGLTFNSDATYTYTFKAKQNKARTDQVLASGVTINSGASIALSGQTKGLLDQGLTLTLISNTSANPISGTFSNLPDGGIVTINGNNFQASYEGGDGNDLILTVVP